MSSIPEPSWLDATARVGLSLRLCAAPWLGAGCEIQAYRVCWHGSTGTRRSRP